jgi:sulfonate transport system ATP-binding protein
MSSRDRIRGEGISYTYLTRTGETLALDGLDLRVRDGEFCSIVGPSGCGKSTLLAIISGLLRPTEGRIYVDGSLLSGVSQKVGILLQKDHLFEWRTVLQNAELGLEILGMSTGEARRQAHRLLQTYGLSGFEGSYPYQLSGGMRQRVALARALAQDSSVLLMDEPFAALDAITRDVLHQELTRVWAEQGLSIVFVTHNVREAARLGQRVVLLGSRPGRVVREWDVDLPHPRTIESPGVSALAAEITRELHQEISRHA